MNTTTTAKKKGQKKSGEVAATTNDTNPTNNDIDNAPPDDDDTEVSIIGADVETLHNIMDYLTSNVDDKDEHDSENIGIDEINLLEE